MCTTEPTITDIRALEIIDNRGRPTIRARVYVEGGHCGMADVPCGSSKGSYEAFDLRDGDERYNGRGVRRAIATIHDEIKPALLGRNVTNQRRLDHIMAELDGTADKSRLGGNAILGVSMAAAQAAADSLGLPLYRYLSAGGHVLPVPQACLINGGVHAGNDLDAQEFCVMPVGSPSFAEATRLVCEVFEALKGLLETRHGKLSTNFGEDGGFAPPLRTSKEAMDLLSEAVEKTGYTRDVVYGLDIAATDDEPAAYAAHLEGLAYVERLCYEVVAALGAPVGETVCVAGGGTGSAAGLQIRADVLGRRLLVPEVPSGAMGAAILAARDVAYGSVTEAARAMVRHARTVVPRGALRDAFGERYARFVAACRARGYLS